MFWHFYMAVVHLMSDKKVSKDEQVLESICSRMWQLSASLRTDFGVAECAACAVSDRQISKDGQVLDSIC